jgi:hypothetical protein
MKALSFGGITQMTKHFRRDNGLQDINLNLTRQFVDQLASSLLL